MPTPGGAEASIAWTDRKGVDFRAAGSNTQSANLEYLLFGARSNNFCSPREGEPLARLFAFQPYVISASSFRLNDSLERRLMRSRSGLPLTRVSPEHLTACRMTSI